MSSLPIRHGRARGPMGRALTRALWLPGRLLRHIMLGAILVYRAVISPALAPRCRFTPTCSAYAAECLKKYGLLRALAKTSWRLLRCQPFGKGGFDPP